MNRAMTLGLAGVILMAPALRGQQRAPSRDMRAVKVAIPRGILGGEGKSKVGRIITFTLVGGVIGGAIAYYTAPQVIPSCVGCEADREPRMIKGALIGASVGLTVGVLVTLGEGKPRLQLRRY